jgi:hypothetical protein
MDGPKGFDPAIADFYERTSEEARLEQGPFQPEEARTDSRQRAALLGVARLAEE